MKRTSMIGQYKRNMEALNTCAILPLYRRKIIFANLAPLRERL